MRYDCALVFPGQGSQYPGMGKDFYEAFEEARLIFDEATETIGRDIGKLCFEGTPEELNLTINTQTAVFTATMAIYSVFEKQGGFKPAFMAGHSLGEYSALTAAQALPLPEMLALVEARAAFMQEAVPPGAGAMATVIGMDRAILTEICRNVSRGEEKVWPANLNAPGQMVVSGTAGAVEEVLVAVKSAGGRALMLPISVPCHCPLLEPAALRLDEALSTVLFSDCLVTVVPNCDPGGTHGRETTKSLLVQQLTAPVRWQESIETIAQRGVTTFIETGPKKTLSGLIRRIVPEARLFNVEDRASLEKTLEHF
ncbi:MAG: ACP S-malonyltransferase [Syntrophales bacterium]|jgi:[acyl-carrier-protein] S-malonyltransferase|nr:ACP S-malonyltransferase [Syntrophales bacterium]MCK9528458.1 ACP S-malonyltransferase [Syntrophales bacterium]MDX9922995.1 ACP S-malonyltransferase [Syntrophales bacterium]